MNLRHLQPTSEEKKNNTLGWIIYSQILWIYSTLSRPNPTRGFNEACTFNNNLLQNKSTTFPRKEKVIHLDTLSIHRDYRFILRYRPDPTRAPNVPYIFNNNLLQNKSASSPTDFQEKRT